MNKKILFLSGGIVTMLAVAFYGHVWRDEAILPIAATWGLVMAFPLGIATLLYSERALGKATMRVVAACYWISACIFTIAAVITYSSTR